MILHVWTLTLRSSEAPAAWNPVLPYLPPNVRFLAYNQRSYAGSSEAFVGQEDGGIDVTAAYLNDLLGFMGFAVDRLGVAGIGSDGKGGVALLVSSVSRLSRATPRLACSQVWLLLFFWRSLTLSSL